MSMPKPDEKPFAIPKLLVWEAWRQVKANKGAPGVDGQALDEFEADLEGNLYKIWNRMSSGSYFPPPVRAVEIPKPHGAGTRVLGVPAAVLEVRLGDRSRRPEVLRHRSLGPRGSCGEAVTDCRWVLLYVRRWLEAPLQRPDGTLVRRDKGTPQGSAISPVLANLFMHYAFDTWMAREFPGCPFERYADDGVPRTLKEESM